MGQAAVFLLLLGCLLVCCLWADDTSERGDAIFYGFVIAILLGICGMFWFLVYQMIEATL